MFPFPPDPIPGDTRFRDPWIHGLLISILIGMAWFALKRRGPDAKDTFSVWFLVWYGVVCVAVIGLQRYRRSTDAICVYAGLASMICFRGAIWNWLPSFNETQRKRAISRSEAVAVFVIMTILLALLAPAVQQAPSRGDFNYCRGRLKCLVLAMHNYHDEYQRFPSAAGSAEKSRPPMSWRIALLPFLEQQSTFDRYDLSATWDQSPNSALMPVSVDAYRCPAHLLATKPKSDDPKYTSFAVPTGPGTVFGEPSQPAMSLKQISDGASNTLLILEACGTNIIWSEPRDIDVLNTPLGVNLAGPSKGLSSGTVSGYHVDGAYVAFADGSVRFMPATTNAKVLREQLTATGGESPGKEEF